MAKSLIAPVPEVYEPAEGAAKDLNPIIFLHAMLCTKEIWSGMPQRVADKTKRTVYTYDARCHGENKDQGEFSFEILVDDLFAYMKSKDIEKAILVGHSIGGKTAISAALKEDKKVEMVFILDMYVKQIPHQFLKRAIIFMEEWVKVVTGLENVPEDEVTMKCVPALYEKLGADMQSPSEKEGYLHSTFRYSKVEGGKYNVCFNLISITNGLKKVLEKEEAAEVSGQYNGPAFFFYGTKSPYEVHGHEEDIKTHFPKAEMVPFADAPHHLFAQASDAFADAIVDRINGASSTV